MRPYPFRQRRPPVKAQDCDGKTVEMDATDRDILNRIQSDFPLEARPYAVLAEQTGLGEEEVLARIRRLRACGIIRRIGAAFHAAGLGFYSTLCAAKVPESALDDFIRVVNAEPGVTHNYLRAHAYNVWFTLIASSREEATRILDSISEATGIAVLHLPATATYKIRVDFQLDNASPLPDGP